MVHAYAQSRNRPSPIGLAAALALSGTMIGALMLSSPAVEFVTDTILETHWVPDDAPPPEAIEPKPRPEAPRSERVVSPDPIVPLIRPDRGPVIELTRDPPPPGGTIGGTGSDPVTIEPITPEPPVLTRAEIDPRFARDFQPDYPSAMIRREIEARVVVRVLVGSDGRVKKVEAVNSIEAAFLAATRAHALARWRFRPATRDGVAIEQWREMAVRFQLDR